MTRVTTGLRRWTAALAAGLFAAAALAQPAEAAGTCNAVRDAPQIPTDLELCANLESFVREPGRHPEGHYQAKLGEYLRNYCHRNPRNGWVSDKKIRDTGPFVGSVRLGSWSGESKGTHVASLIWYSPEMYAWLKANRPDHSELPKDASAVPDGAMMVKEMYPAPASVCGHEDPAKLQPTNGAAIMVRASAMSHDGWYWGWFGFTDWKPDWPATPANSYPNMGFGQYCLNCHASAKGNSTFASLKNVKGHPGEPLVFLTQSVFGAKEPENHHAQVAEAVPSMLRQAPLKPDYHPEFLRVYGGARPVLPSMAGIDRLPSETYDNVWAIPGSKLANSFVTSDQCLGCHAAGSTGLQFDMTEIAPTGRLVNHSPWATWRSSPMGLSGRDPFFYAQVESETQTFHPGSAKLIYDTCFGCHGIGGQRQLAMENVKADGSCAEFDRTVVDATPLENDPGKGMARFGALARDGITCLACHRMALGPDADAQAKAPQNACVAQRQEKLNHGFTGLARTFTGSFPIAAPDQVFGPFEQPKELSMRNAVGMVPQHRGAISSSEVCASCHTVHLPILKDGRVIGHAYEQATYAEWLFSDYRAGAAPGVGALPLGPGATPQSCQHCHMRDRDAQGVPIVSKVASIQEYSSFPQAENVAPPKEIDLQARPNFSKHTLVGLNIVLVKMAQQFSAILGNRTDDPMLPRRGVPPLETTENAILAQARNDTAAIAVSSVSRDEETLKATVTVRNKAGHKFPSGVGFRRAFVEFVVRDEAGAAIWASGRTNAMGVIEDGAGKPLDGELWWDGECKARIEPETRAHQTHFQTIRSQGQAQIYQELVAAPGPGEDARCGEDAPATGPLTTSFLSVCKRVKDNRILPGGYLPYESRRILAAAIGADEKLAAETGSVGVEGDPDYVSGGGQDAVSYEIPLKDLGGRRPRTVEATLYYQAQPPFYIQDRFCTAKGRDGDRLFLLAGFLRQAGAETRDWKLRLVSTGGVGVP